jgi:hypothetical protein
MGSREGIELAEIIRKKVAELSELCEGLDEAVASRAPKGRWSPKEIISHVSGREGEGFIPAIEAFLKQETPLLDLEAANPFFTGKRRQKTMAELLSEMKGEYERMAEVVSGLSPDQLARKARVPLFKETPIGEYPTLAVFVRALAEHHVSYHIDHMKEILGELGVPARK